MWACSQWYTMTGDPLDRFGWIQMTAHYIRALVCFSLSRALAHPGTPEHEAACALARALEDRVMQRDPGALVTLPATGVTPRND